MIPNSLTYDRLAVKACKNKVDTMCGWGWEVINENSNNSKFVKNLLTHQRSYAHHHEILHSSSKSNKY